MSRVWKALIPVILLAAFFASAWSATTLPPQKRVIYPRVSERGPFEPANRVWGMPYQVGATATIMPGTQMGLTFYDFQHNGSVGRHVDEQGAKIQCTWMKGHTATPSVRDIRWNKVAVIGSPANFTLDNGKAIKRLPLGIPFDAAGLPFAGTRTGYTNFRNQPNGMGIAVYHDAPEEAVVQELWTQIDKTAGSGLFFPSEIPEPTDPKYGADAIIWPKEAVSVCGADTIVHVVGGWYGGEEIWYWRGLKVADSAQIIWSTGILVDAGGSSTTPVVEAFGSEVAVGFIKQFNATNLDITIRRSFDCGVTWNLVENVTNYGTASAFGASEDVNMVYDESGNLHIIWPTAPSDGTTAPCHLYHWSAATGARLINSAGWTNNCDGGEINAGSNNGAGSRNLALADPGLSVKPAGVYGANELMYAIWTQYGPTDTDCATIDAIGTQGGLVNPDIYVSVSSNSGLTWDRPQNVTGTVTPDCMPGDCAGESWATVAARSDSGLYLSYVMDTHTGGIVQGEGVWTESPYHALAVEARPPVLAPVCVPSPTTFYELNAKTDMTSTTQLAIIDAGNADLSYTVTVTSDNGGQAHVLVNGAGSASGTVTAGSAPDVITITYDGIGLQDTSLHMWRLEVTSNDSLNNPGLGGTPIDIILEVFVANEWYTCTRDTISTGQHRLAVTSCLELFDGDLLGGGFTRYSDSAEWGYSASPIITCMDNGVKRAWRNVFFNATDRRRDLNQSFRAQSPFTITRGLTTDVASGEASNTDTTIWIEYEITTYKEPTMYHGFTTKMTLTNLKPTPTDSLSWGAAGDVDVKNDSVTAADNKGFGNEALGYLGMQGVKPDTDMSVLAYYDMYAALFHVPLNGGCTEDGAAAGQAVDNNQYVIAAAGYVTDSLYNLVDRFGDLGSWGVNTYNTAGEDTVSDLNAVLVSAYNQTLAPATPVSYAFGFAVSDLSIADLEATIGAIRLAVNPACGCPILLTGDVAPTNKGSVNSSDIIWLVNYVFKGGNPPDPCIAAGDVNCHIPPINGAVNSSDIIYLVNYVFKGGAAPCDACTSPAPC